MKAPLCTFLLVAALGFLPAFAQQINLPDLQSRVAKGDPEAELELGRAYHLGGRGVPKDFAKAADLYRKAAAQGNAKAMYNLGFIYHRGQGVAVDDKSAAQWFQKAAEQGLPAAQLELGLAYMHGDLGEPTDKALAVRWLTLAAKQPDAPGQSGPAANALGSLYESGSGVQRDGQQAIFWYRQGAEMGDPKARFNLGRVYGEGMLTKIDLVQSYMWLKLAAYQGDPLATHLLSEELAAKTFSDAQITEGERKVADFQVQHHQAPLNGSLPVVMDPEVAPQHGAKGSAPMTNAAPLTPAKSP